MGPRVGGLVQECLFSTFPSPDGEGLREEGAEERFWLGWEGKDNMLFIYRLGLHL